MSLLARRGVSTPRKPAPAKPQLVPAGPPAQSERFGCRCTHCKAWRESQRVLFTALRDAVSFLEITSKINCIRWTDAEHARIRELAALVGKP